MTPPAALGAPGPNDRRSRRLMTQFARERLALEDRGWSRSELEAVVRAQPQFRRRMERNPKALGELIRRLIGRGEVEQRDGKLFAAEPMQISICARRELFELVRHG
jgi:hypothetical protein